MRAGTSPIQQDFKFCYVDYIAKVIAAIKELGLKELLADAYRISNK